MKGVILTAGVGSRFGSYTVREHKLLLTVNDIPIIDYTLSAFSRAGISEVGLITGFMEDRIVDCVGDGSRYGLKVNYIFNPDYKLGNALSVLAARTFTNNQPFVLSMGDHMVSPELITHVLGCGGNYHDNVLGVDFDLTMRHVQESTRVQVETDGSISSIGKQIIKWNGVDSGVFRFNPGIYASINQWVSRDKTGQYELGGALAYLIRQGGLLKGCDISEDFWYDVDDFDDLKTLQASGIRLSA